MASKSRVQRAHGSLPRERTHTSQPRARMARSFCDGCSAAAAQTIPPSQQRTRNFITLRLCSSAFVDSTPMAESQRPTQSRDPRRHPRRRGARRRSPASRRSSTSRRRRAAALPQVREPAAGRRVQDSRRLQHGGAADAGAARARRRDLLVGQPWPGHGARGTRARRAGGRRDADDRAGRSKSTARGRSAPR